MSREMQSSVVRLHCNLGHPPKQESVRILAAAGKLDSKLLSALDALRCGSCIRMTKTVKPSTSSTSSAVRFSGAFGDHLQADIIFVRTLNGEACPVLGMTCMSTNFHAAKPIENRSPETVLEAMIEIWYRPLGLPISITVDADTCFLGKNQQWHQNLGIEYDIIPTEEAWRLDKIGRRNALMRTLAERLIDQNAVLDKKHLNEILPAVLFSMNSSTYTYGRPPYQAVFGRIPRLVGDLVSDNKSLAISTQTHPEQHAIRPELLRAEAITALAQFTASQAVKSLRKTRNMNELSHLQPGQTIAFWRMQGKSRQHLGRFLAFDPDKKSCWIQVGKTSVRVGTTQLRPATGWENWTPSDADLKLIKQAENNFAAGLWLEDGAEGPDLEDEMNVDEEIFQFRPTKIPRRSDGGQPALPEGDQDQQQRPAGQSELDLSQHQPYEMMTLPAGPAVPRPADPSDSQQVPPPFQPQLTIQQSQQQHQYQQQQNIQNYDQRHITVNVESPTFRSTVQNYGPQVNFGPVPPTPRRAARSRSPPVTPRRSDTAQPAPLGTPAIQEAQGDQLMDEPETPVLPPDHHLQALFTIYDNNTAEMKAKFWDGSPELRNPYFHNQKAYTAYLNSSKRIEDLKGITEPERPDWFMSDDEDGEVVLELSNNRSLTRQEIKQLDRELPWREVMEMPTMMLDKFVQSADKEYQGWMKWAGIRPLSEKEAAEVWSCPSKKRRILKSRAAYRDKSRGVGELKAKTRVVLIGCGDPDLRQLSRDSPTPSRLSEFLVLSIAASGSNALFNHDNKTWSLWISDAAQAFLQGRQDPTERSGPLYMSPPRDPIINMAAAYPAELYEVIGNCYGLANAPRVWFRRVQEQLLSISFVQHSFDKCLFYHIGKDGLLDCVLICHVDDFMAAYSETFDIDSLRNLFEWGSVTILSPETPGEYRGKEIIMELKEGKNIIRTTQKKLLDNLAEGKIPVGRMQKDPKLSAEEWKETRSVCGCLQWLGGQTRPDVAATASLSHRGGDTEIADLKRLHETLRYARRPQNLGSHSQPFPSTEVLCW